MLNEWFSTRIFVVKLGAFLAAVYIVTLFLAAGLQSIGIEVDTEPTKFEHISM